MEVVVLSICFVSCAVLGFGVGALLQQYVLLVLERTRDKNFLANLGRVLAWFLGHGAVGFVLIEGQAYIDGTTDPLVELMSVMGYLMGFGLTIGLMFIVSKRFRQSMNKARELTRDRRVAIMLLLLDYGIPPEQVAQSTGLSNRQVAELYEEALRLYGKR